MRKGVQHSGLIKKSCADVIPEDTEVAEIIEDEKVEQVSSDKWMQQAYAGMRKSNRMKFR